MGYTIEVISLSDVKEKLSAYKYALLYKIESVDLVILTGVDDPNDLLKECYEARFFDEAGELHLYEQDGELVGIAVCDANDEDFLLTEYALDNQYLEKGKSLIVKQYLKPDDDGQMNVVLTRLAGIAR